jgi:hypothetical protein
LAIIYVSYHMAILVDFSTINAVSMALCRTSATARGSYVAARPENAPITTDGTLELNVVTNGDATPFTGLPVVDTTPTGHTRIPLSATVVVIRRRVGATTSVKVVDAAAPEYVAEKTPDDETVVRGRLNVPVEYTSALVGRTECDGPNVTGTLTSVPAINVSPVANVPSVTVFTSSTTA